MTLSVPANVWHTVSLFVDPNPFSYLRYGLVNKSSAHVFAGDELWRQVAPYNVNDHFERVFREDANSLEPRLQKLLVALWDDIELVKSTGQNGLLHLNRHCDKYDSIVDDMVNSRTLALPWAVWSGMAMESALEASPKGGILRKLPFWKDERFVACCITLCPFLLNFCDKSLKTSPTVVLAAVKRDKMAILWAAPSLRDDLEFILKAVRTNPQILRYISPEMQTNAQVALAAVGADGAALQGLNAFQNDKAVVIAAIRNDPHALRFASPTLQADRVVVFEAVKRDPWTFNYAAPEVKNDRELVLEAVMREGDLLRVASQFVNDPEIVQAAVEADGTALQYAGKELRADRDLVETALETDGTALQFAAKELRDDRELVEAAIETDPEALQFASKALRRDKSMIDLQKDAENRPRATSLSRLGRKSSMIANSTTSLATMVGLQGIAPLSSLTSKAASNSTPDIPQWKKTYTSSGLSHQN